MKKLFEFSSASECLQPEILYSPRPSNEARITEVRLVAQTNGFSDLTALLYDWNPCDSAASRCLLTNELLHMLEDNHHTCIKAFIPAIIVDGLYPIDLMHYYKIQDIGEFMTRMHWMHEEYNAAIGILFGISDEETAAMINNAYQRMFIADEDCIVMLM